MSSRTRRVPDCDWLQFGDDSSLVASARPRSDWLEAPVGLAVVPETATRGALAAAWLRDAQIEHAAIATYARFSLQLLALGAPPELVCAAHQGALDKVEHAQACFALASRYAGCALGPGELPVPSEPAFGGMVEAAAAVLREGCVAATLAARLAYEQLQHASDETAQAALLRIATDETQHAAFAYQFLRWAISREGLCVCAAVNAGLAAVREQILAAEVALDGELALEEWHAHGRLSARERRACMVACFHEVIEPCVRGLLEAPLDGQGAACAPPV